MIRNEDYEAEEGRAGQRVNMSEMKSGILRQATKTEEEQVCTMFLRKVFILDCGFRKLLWRHSQIKLFEKGLSRKSTAF